MHGKPPNQTNELLEAQHGERMDTGATARQGALILTWRPCERSTCPKTAAGKARSSRNADKPESFNRRIQTMKKEVAALVSQAKEIRHFFT